MSKELDTVTIPAWEYDSLLSMVEVLGGVVDKVNELQPDLIESITSEVEKSDD